MQDYRVYTSDELDEFAGKEVVVYFEGDGFWHRISIEGLITQYNGYTYLVHNNDMYSGCEPDDLKGYSYGFCINGKEMNISLKTKKSLKTETTIKLINKSSNPDPDYATEQSAGCDIRAFIADPITLKPLQRTAVPTGLYIELPEGYEAQIRPRSGLAFNCGVTVLNSPGTIDADYRGEIKVLLVNLSDNDFIINNGDRICQMVVTKYERLAFEATDSLSYTVRGDGGFGHTGTK